MKIIKDVLEFQKAISKIQKTIGLVPTMGALHLGHGELVKKSVLENEVTVVSIFVNPTQFNNKDDLDKYPRNIESDIKFLENLKVDYLFMPDFNQMYPDDYKFKISENDFSKVLCGQDRPGHFDGVLTICLKLFMLTKAHRAYFGKKDFQQYKLVTEMVDALFLNISIIGIDTIREEDGLAMSSRNLRLSHEARKRAPLIYKTIKNENDLTKAKAYLTEQGFKIDYLEEIQNRRFIAANIEGIRLIDNVSI